MTLGKPLVIGYGSPLRSDDTIGPRAATALGELHPDWDVITAVQLTPELAEPISRAARVIFIDAAVGEPPGAVRCEAVVPAALEHGFTHHATPSSLLASAAELYNRAPDALPDHDRGAGRSNWAATYRPRWKKPSLR
ncbi:MAG: hydrogenase maturation protease [Anaerolineae bacterium]